MSVSYIIDSKLFKENLINQLSCNICQQSPNCTKCHPDLLPKVNVNYSCARTIWNDSAFELYQTARAARLYRGQQTPKAEILGLKTHHNFNVSDWNPLPKFPKPLNPIPDTPQPTKQQIENKKHQCSLCHKKFSRKDSILRHKRKSCVLDINSDYNRKSKFFKCNHCQRIFGLKKNLNQHLKNKHLRLNQ